MSTFWQLLRIGFWMLPLQRALTVIGAAVLVAGQVFRLPLNMPGSSLPITFLGAALMMIVPLLAGGVFLRMLSSSRALLLRPHARGRLLSGALGIVMLVTLAWIVCYWMAFLHVPLKYRPDIDAYVLMFAMTLSFGTLSVISLFIASRSPLWTLVMLLAWQAPGLLLHAFGVEDASRLTGGPVSLISSAGVWMAFALWFLRTRHIHAGAWRRRESIAVQAVASAARAPAVTREQAMSRWVLANATPAWIGAQCLLACLVLLVLQWVLGHEAGNASLQATMFGALSAVTLVTGAIGSSMARRSRALWLPAGRNRLELHGWIERQLLWVVSAVLLGVVLAAVPVWFMLTPRPSLPVGYLVAAMLMPGLCAGWLGLMQQHQRSLFDALAGIAIMAAIFYGLVVPVYTTSAAPRWGVLGAEVALAVLLREVAYVRWRSADWRRAQHD